MDIQQWMQSVLINSGPDSSYTVEDLISPSGTLTPGQSLAIYKKAYYGRLLACLQEQFKALNSALGPQLFRDFAYDYLQHYPSHSHTLSLLGAKFSQYLEDHRPDRAAPIREAWIDFVIELAKFEWMLYETFDTEKSVFCRWKDTNGTTFNIQSDVSLIMAEFPVHWYYRMVQHNKEISIPARQATPLAIHRKNFKIVVSRLNESQYTFLAKARKEKIQSESIPYIKGTLTKSDKQFLIESGILEKD